MPGANTPPDCFTFMLAKAYQRAHGYFRKALEPFGITNIQHAVLEALWYRDGQTATEEREMERSAGLEQRLEQTRSRSDDASRRYLEERLLFKRFLMALMTD